MRWLAGYFFLIISIIRKFLQLFTEERVIERGTYKRCDSCGQFWHKLRGDKKKND